MEKFFLVEANSKYGTDIKCFKDLKDAHDYLDNHCKILSKDKNVDRNSFELGVYDSWNVFLIEKKEVELISFLNNLFNLLNVNKSFLNKIEGRE